MTIEEVTEFVGILDDLSKTLRKENRVKVARLQELFTHISEPSMKRKEAEDLGLRVTYSGFVPSAIVGNTINAFTNTPELLRSARETVGAMDKATSDILHAIELLDADHEDVSHWYEELRKIRKVRRGAKDFIELMEPFVAIVDDIHNHTLVQRIKEAHTHILRRSKQLKERKYTPRELTTMEKAFQNAKKEGDTVEIGQRAD